MSRTEAHEPWHVIIRKHARPEHDHRNGECDLVDVELWCLETPDPTEPRCSWLLPAGFLSEHPVCGCKLCTGAHERRAERRHDRHEAHKNLRYLDDEE